MQGVMLRPGHFSLEQSNKTLTLSVLANYVILHDTTNPNKTLKRYSLAGGKYSLLSKLCMFQCKEQAWFCEASHKPPSLYQCLPLGRGNILLSHSSCFAVFLKFSTTNTYFFDNLKSQANKCHFSKLVDNASGCDPVSFWRMGPHGQGHHGKRVSWPYCSGQDLYIVVKRKACDMPLQLPALY